MSQAQQVQLPQTLTVPTQTFLPIADYLASRPWAEVNNLMAAVQSIVADNAIKPEAAPVAAADPVAPEAPAATAADSVSAVVASSADVLADPSDPVA